MPEEGCEALPGAVPPPCGEAATSHSTSSFPRFTEQQLTDEPKCKVINLPSWWQLSNFNMQLYANTQSLAGGEAFPSSFSSLLHSTTQCANGDMPLLPTVALSTSCILETRVQEERYRIAELLGKQPLGSTKLT